MDFTGHEDHSITLGEAAQLTSRYRGQMGTNDKQGGFFGKDTLKRILDQSDCVGIRYYYGLDSEGTQVLVLVGAKANNDDIVNGELAQASVPCPEYCSDDNGLNS